MTLFAPLRLAASALFWTGDRTIMTSRGRLALLGIIVIGSVAFVIEGFGLFALMAALFQRTGKAITLGMLVGMPTTSGIAGTVIPIRLIFLLVVGRLLIAPVLDFSLQRLSVNLGYRLRLAVIKEATSLPALNAGMIPSGELATIVNDEVARCGRAFISISEGVQLIGGVTLATIFLIARDPALNVAGLGAALPLLLLYAFVARRSSKESRSLVAARISAGANVTEGLRSLAAIQAAGGGPTLLRTLSDNVDKIRHHELRFHRNHVTLKYIISLIPIFAAVGAFAYAWFGRGATTISALAAQLMPTAVVGGRIAAAGTALVTSFYMTSINVNSFTPVKNLLDRLSVLGRRGRTKGTAPASADRRLKEVRLEGCSFQLPNGSWLFRDVTLHIRPGQPVIVRGASGTGKSTLATLVAGANDPTEGRITYVLEDGSTSAPHDTFINYLSQDPAVIAGSIRSNLLLGVDQPPDDEVLIEALKRVRLWDELGPKGGLEAQVFEGARNLSGGQIRRLGLARLIARDKSLWIFDEATASLDASSASIVEGMIRQLAATKVVVIITHDDEFRVAGTEVRLSHDAPVQMMVSAA